MRTLGTLIALAVGMTGFLPAADAFTPAGPLQSGSYSKEDLKKLLEAKVSDATIIAYLKRNPPGPNLSAQDLIELRAAGADDAVLAAMVEASTTANAAPATPPYGGPGDDSSFPNDYSYYTPYVYPYYYPSYYYPNYGFSLSFGVPFHVHDRFHPFHPVPLHPGHFQHGFQGPVFHGSFHGNGGGHAGGGGHR